MHIKTCHYTAYVIFESIYIYIYIHENSIAYTSLDNLDRTHYYTHLKSPKSFLSARGVVSFNMRAHARYIRDSSAQWYEDITSIVVRVRVSCDGRHILLCVHPRKVLARTVLHAYRYMCGGI